LAKNLKLNIKNAQIAEALKKFNKSSVLSSKKETSAAASKRKSKEKEVEKELPQEQKRKARIIPPEEIKEKTKDILEEVSFKKEKKQKKVEEKQKKPDKEKELVEVNEEKIEVKPELEIEEKKVEKTPAEEGITEKITAPEDLEKSKIEKPSVVEKELELEEKKSFKSFKDFKAAKKPEVYRSFDTQDRLGLRAHEEERWRKKRFGKIKKIKEVIPIIRPTSLKVKIPISIKDLAQEMKLKASELIQKLFMQGVILNINDVLEDETTIQLLGNEFGCEITIDVEEEKRLQITENSIKDEITSTPKENLILRPAVITFMGHVDHGKTSLIDVIRKSNLAAFEAGKITQHIGAFTAKTKFGVITILDTPGHEAFSEMRSRGALVTDIVVLVIAGDEGIKEQTIEALNQAKAAKVPIVVALNKCDKPGFDAEKIYRQLADNSLLPEVWGGTTITVNCSAKTGEGINNLLEMLSLQAEILELRANPNTRARGTILESEMHKGLGPVATVLVQNGTLKSSNSIVFGDKWGRIKSMYDQFENNVTSAGPSIPVKITGLSHLAEAGCEFVVVENEKKAKDLAEGRSEKIQLRALQTTKKITLESIHKKEKKVLPIIIRADVQGSLEALKASLLKINSDKVDLIFVNAGVGEISESDIQLAHASKAIILGFHTKIESHAEPIIKQLKVIVRQHDIIYHAIDEVKELMRSTLDKIEEQYDIGKAKVIAVFKSSQLGLIAGCLVMDGIIKRNSHVRIIRDGQKIFETKINSLKRVKEDVKEVNKGLECGIVLENFSDVKKDDIFEAYDINYLEPQL
jgi:translation initiation factor IF-2